MSVCHPCWCTRALGKHIRTRTSKYFSGKSKAKGKGKGKGKAAEKAPVKVEKTPVRAAAKPKKSTPTRGSSKATKAVKDEETEAPKKAAGKRGWRPGPKVVDQPDAPPPSALPHGAPNCLEGVTVVVTGVLPTLDRDSATEYVKQYGGYVSRSRQTNATSLN